MKSILFHDPQRYKSPGALEADEHFRNKLSSKFDVALDWQEFVSKMSQDYDIVAIHSELVNNDPIGLKDKIITIQTLLKVYNCNSKITVCINKECDRSTVEQLKRMNIAGIIPSRLYWGLDQATDAWQACLDGSHWPEDIISSLPHRDKKHVAYFCPKNHDIPIDHKIEENLLFTRFHSLSELSSALMLRLDCLIFHCEILNENTTSASEFMLMLNTLSRQLKINLPKLVFTFERDTHINTIKDLQKNNITYFSPTVKSFGLDEANDSIDTIARGETHYYPKHLIDKLPGNIKIRRQTGQPSLTPRQREIYDLISKRGLRNKQIAKVLNISESTVKIHVSGIFKILCVRNRTQLALSKIN